MKIRKTDHIDRSCISAVIAFSAKMKADVENSLTSISPFISQVTHGGYYFPLLLNLSIFRRSCQAGRVPSKVCQMRTSQD